MKIFFKNLRIYSRERLELIDLTQRVKEVLASSKIQNGFLSICSFHTTTGLFLNEFQDALIDDIKRFLQKLVDDNNDYGHNANCDRQNATSHLRSLFLGQTLPLQVASGSLVLGQFQSIILAELDGPQTRNLRIQIMGE